MMKKYLGLWLCLISSFAFGQATYNPTYTPMFTVASKPYAISQAAPVDGRSYKMDSVNFIWRLYNGTSEVLSYLNLAKYRTGQFPIEVNVGGTLNSNGTFTGGYPYEYWFRGGTADSNLVLKSFWPTNTTGFLLASNNLSDVASASTARTNLGLGSMATQSTTVTGTDITGTYPGALTVNSIQGHNLGYIQNYNNLTYKPTIPAQFNPIAGTNMALAGTYPNITFNANFTGLFDTVATINELINGNFGSNIVVVTDTFAGGIFRLQSTPATIDSGKIFPALGISDTSYWVRILNNGIGNNVEWYGAIPNVSTTSVAHANAIAIQRDMNANIDVFFPGRANFYIDSTLHLQNGQNIFGPKADLGNTTTGATITTIDTVTALDYANNGDNNAFSWIHDLAFNNTASGGVFNAGVVIARGFAHMDRVTTSNFGYHGVWITSTYLGHNTITDGVVLDQCYSAANGVDGFHVGGGSDNNLVTISNSQATNNLNDGFFSGGAHNIFSNDNGTYNYNRDFEDGSANTIWLNNYAEGGRGDTFYVNSAAEGGIVLSGAVFGAVYPTGPGLANNYAVKIGTYSGNYFTQSGVFGRVDTTAYAFNGELGFLDIIPVGCVSCGPGAFLMRLDSSTLRVDMVNASVYNKLGIGNPGLTTLNEYTTYDVSGVIIGQPVNGNPVNVSLGMRTNTNFGGAHALIGGQLFTGGESEINFDFYDRHSSTSTGVDAGIVRSTAVDTAAGNFRSNNFSGRDHINPTTGLWSFYTFGGVETQASGGAIRFQNGDTTTALYIDPVLKQVGIEKYEPQYPLDVAGRSNTDSLSLTTFSPSPFKGGDSALVWNASTHRVHMISPQSGNSIFIPTTGNTITLIKNQYNIVNPAGSLLALTVTLPSSPNDKDFVKIKYVQSITTVTYAGGTVADGITSPVAGGLVELHYDAPSSTWY